MRKDWRDAAGVLKKKKKKGVASVDRRRLKKTNVLLILAGKLFGTNSHECEVPPIIVYRRLLVVPKVSMNV